ncbi:MAG: methyltransferase domain-containing protein [Ardenticatenia bacterium]|nr:methyltransferase domain-containing protein [Ardenticatenia bacterium]
MKVPRCDYEGSCYQSEFWTSERAYEDLAERVALRHLLPAGGHRLIEIGAGGGRLFELYRGYEEVYLLDYARSQLEYARARVDNRPGLYLVQGDVYALPFVDGFFDTLVTVRVLHHVVDLGAALEEVARVSAPGAVYVVEFANKRNAKAILRWAFRRARPGERPFDLSPYEFVPLNVDYHPAHLRWALRVVGFEPSAELAVSHFRLPVLKRLVPARWLATLDACLQGPTARLRLTPSLMIRARLVRQQRPAPAGARWRCPACGGMAREENRDVGVICEECGRRYPVREGIYVMRADLAEPRE